MGYNGLNWVLVGYIELKWVKMGYDGLNWVLVGYIGL